MSSPCTLVTGYYCMKSKFPSDRYKEWMRNFFQLDSYKVIFTDESSKPLIQECDSSEHKDKHTYIIQPISHFYSSKFDSMWTRNYLKDYESSYHSIDLYKIWAEKTHLMQLAIHLNLYKSDYYVWCDIGAFRDAARMDVLSKFPLPHRIENITMLQIEPFRENELSNVAEPDERFLRVNRIGGGIIAGHKDDVIKWRNTLSDTLQQFFKRGIFAGKDQTVYAFNILKHPWMCRMVRIPKDYPYDPWFYMEDYLSQEPKKNPLVTVIIPIYNGSQYLRSCLTSILKQTYRNMEVIIGLNGHPIDGETFQNIKHVVSDMKTDIDIRVMQFEVASKVITSNRLVQEANGERIALLDVDDLWLPEKLQKQIDVVNEHDFAVVGTQCEYFGDKTGSPSIILGRIANDAFMHTNHIINSSFLMRKELAWWDPSSKPGVDDYDLWLRLASKGYSFYNVPEILVRHNVSTSTFFNPHTAENTIRSLQARFSPADPTFLKRVFIE